MSKKQSLWILLGIAVCAMVFAVVQSRLEKPAKPETEVKSFTYPMMGTIVNVQFFGETPEVCEVAAKAVHNKFAEVEKLCSVFSNESELFALNAKAFDAPFKCSEELYEILRQSREAYIASDGNFDITVKPLMELWGFYRKRSGAPSESERLETLKKVGMEKVIFDDENRTVRFTVKGMGFDLGGIAKGIALDCAASAALKAGAKNFLLNLGGNIIVRGRPSPEKETFDVGIRNPEKNGGTIGTFQLKNQACATSGNYERFSMLEGKKHGHIMNVFTGKPVEEFSSVTVIAPNAALTDIYSTAVFIGGRVFADKVSAALPKIKIITVPGGKMKKL